MKRPSDTLPLGVLLGSAALVAAVTFAASAHGLYDLGGRVMGLPGVMAACVPIGLDGAQLVAIAAAFAMQDAPWFPKRFYIWVVIAVTVALSMAGNMWDAHVRGLTPQGVYATMIAPALLALMAHVIVVTWRWHEEGKKPAAVAVAVKQVKPRAAKSINGNRRARALALKADKVPYEEIAKRLGVSLSTVNRDLREPVSSLNGDAA